MSANLIYPLRDRRRAEDRARREEIERAYWAERDNARTRELQENLNLTGLDPASVPEFGEPDRIVPTVSLGKLAGGKPPVPPPAHPVAIAARARQLKGDNPSDLLSDIVDAAIASDVNQAEPYFTRDAGQGRAPQAQSADPFASFDPNADAAKTVPETRALQLMQQNPDADLVELMRQDASRPRQMQPVGMPHELPVVRRVKASSVPAASRPQGSIDPNFPLHEQDPDRLRKHNLGPLPGDSQGHGALSFEWNKDDVALEGRDFERQTRYRVGPRRALVPIPDPNAREPRSLDILLSSLLDDPEDKKTFFGHVLSPGNPGAAQLQYFDGKLYQLGKDGKFYLVIPPGSELLSEAGDYAALLGGAIFGGGAVGLGLGFLGKSLATVLGAGGGEVAKAAFRDWLLEEYVKHRPNDRENIMHAMWKALLASITGQGVSKVVKPLR